MPQYAYRAINTNGRQLRGALAATSELDLQQALGAVGLELIDCRLTAKRRAGSARGGRLGARDLVQFCVHLEQLQRAGVPLLESLADVRDFADSGRLRDLTAEIRRDVSEGQPLSVAFGRHPHVFGNVFTALIAAGEETGKLADSFHELARHLRWNAAMMAKVRKATRYPAVVGCVVTGVTVFMLAGVVPQVVDFLAANNAQLPVWTVALIATSAFVQEFWPLLLALPPAAFVAIRILVKRSPGFAFRFDGVLLGLPVAGQVVRKLALARFAQIFAVMFQSGIDILTCLAAGQRVIGNRVLGEALALAGRQVQAGSSLSAALTATGEFPTRITRMVKIGEDTGNLAETLGQVAEIYDRDVDAAIEVMIGLLEPGLTAVLGLVMAWIALAVFGPIYDNLGQIGG